MFRLYIYSSDLKANNFKNFENLKLGIMNMFNENKRLRFAQIDFHSAKVDFNDIIKKIYYFKKYLWQLR